MKARLQWTEVGMGREKVKNRVSSNSLALKGESWGESRAEGPLQIHE